MEVYDVTAVNLFTDESLPVTFSVWDDEEVDASCLKVESSSCDLQLLESISLRYLKF